MYSTLTAVLDRFKTSYKLESVRNYIEKFKIDILFLQETHIDNLHLGQTIDNKLGGKTYWSFSFKQGVGIFISNKLQANIVGLKFYHVVEGRIINLDIDTG